MRKPFAAGMPADERRPMRLRQYTAVHRDRRAPLHRARLRRGCLVQVRSAADIKATLDERGCLEGMPFMPEMLPLCGQRLRVFRRADLTCVDGFDAARRHTRTVLLEGVSCDGAAHDGCQRGCLILWKERWLRPVDATRAIRSESDVGHDALATMDDAGTFCAPARRPDGTFFCQSTELRHATAPYTGSPLAQLAIESLNGNLTPGEIVARAAASVRRRLRRALNRAHPAGRSPATPTATLGLQPGDLVEVRSAEEIKHTLDSHLRNRGLAFEDPMFRLCGGRFRVAGRIARIVLETTGEMRLLNDTVALEGVTCPSCPRAQVLYWREIWLRRVPETTAPPTGVAPPATTAEDRPTLVRT